MAAYGGHVDVLAVREEDLKYGQRSDLHGRCGDNVINDGAVVGEHITYDVELFVEQGRHNNILIELSWNIDILNRHLKFKAVIVL